ncbi:peroxidase 51 [Selaginella moellendorffii]|uniref:peroxidase 51 n=1 Tax=Selaginella moellendorffii TaxID=88036 RepID=UPI000D1C5EC2|nr:peroxidase 51 [Selaginella moellendorffii]|eukprot:XP_024514911.1 peroxidase 51 [Selaginella moellendorffii]
MFRYDFMDKTLLLLLVITVCVSSSSAQLSVGFYGRSCPRVESIVKRVALDKFKQAPTSAAATVRLFFHDCFVEGCDASVTLASTPANRAEKDADINKSLAGDAFDSVMKAKKAVEAECPGVVSCADVLAILTRDFVGLTGGPAWQVKKGRRDGRISRAEAATANLPGAEFSVNQLLKNFATKGLNLVDLVSLSGAHTFGFAHCDQFSSRLYNFSSSNRMDPTMSSSFASDLKKSCPIRGGNPNLVEPFDPVTPFEFDNAYYKNLLAGRGLVTSDQELYSDRRTRKLVRLFSKKRQRFFNAFADAMDKMGSIGVKTGTSGEIRRDCSRIN